MPHFLFHLVEVLNGVAHAETGFWELTCFARMLIFSSHTKHDHDVQVKYQNQL